MSEKEINSVLEKYEIDVSYFKKSGAIVAVNAIKFCEAKNIVLDKPLFSRSEVSRNAYIHYLCDCGEKASSELSNFVNKTVFACKKCNAGKINKIFKPIQTENLCKVLEKNGFKVVKTDHKNNISESKWILNCKYNHQFEISGSSIKNLTNCPHCYKSSIEEEWTRCLVEHHFGKEFINVRPNWLINPETNKNLEIDLFNDELGLAIEYHGPQHYKAIYGEERLQKSLRNDGARRVLCEKNNVRLIEIKHPEQKKTKKDFLDYIVVELSKNEIYIGEDSVTFALNKSIDVNKTGKVIDNIKNRLLKKNKKFISCHYENSQSAIIYECNKCHSKHETSGAKIYTLKDDCMTCNKNNKKKIVIERHEKVVKKYCEKMKVDFKNLVMNSKSQVTGFVYSLNQEDVAVGNKKYRQILIEMKS